VEYIPTFAEGKGTVSHEFTLDSTSTPNGSSQNMLGLGTVYMPPSLLMHLLD